MEPAPVHETLRSIDIALKLLGVSPDQLQICSGDNPRIDAQRPAFVTVPSSVDGVRSLSASLVAVYPSGHPVSVFHGLHTDQAEVIPTTIGDLEELTFEAIHIPALDPLADLRRFDGLFHIVVERLNAPDGCPWDNDQTHESLRPFLIEEAYELIEAIDEHDAASMAEELGDVLLQILMHTAVANRSGAFSFGDITESISRKMIQRHPHVFGDAQYRPNWEDLKKQEHPDRSALDGVPPALPALAQSQTIQSRARKAGFDWPDVEGPLEKLSEELAEFARAASEAEREDEFGDIIFVVANIADHLGIDAEQALRLANAKFRRRFMRVEQLARDSGLDMEICGLDALNELWEQAKADLATEQL